MLFNSLKFIIFFIVVIVLYFSLPHKWRNILLLIASYFFYMCWEPGYALLILLTTSIVYVTALLMVDKSLQRKKLLVVFSLVSNLGILFTFKYFNFVTSNLNNLFKVIDFNYTMPSLKFLLPVGISFYTLQALSYTIDVYRGDIKAEKSFIVFALYVTFFPQLVAGPIERSTRLLPQFYKSNDFNYERVTDGLKIMAWGFFKKLVVADRLALYVNKVFNNPTGYEGGVLILASCFFSFQVYCDFSGYSDIAIGTAQVMGYNLMDNFKRPFHSKTISELWQRWHISLTSWFRDYVYIPLGGNRVSKARWAINIMIVFILSGLWHGAEWTFVVWSALNGLFTVFGVLTFTPRKKITDSIYYEIENIPASILSIIGIPLIFGGLFAHKIGFSDNTNISIEKMIIILIGLFIVFFAFEKVVNHNINNVVERVRAFIQVFITFILFTLAVIFFRAKSIQDGWYIITHLFSLNMDNINLGFSRTDFALMFISIFILEVFHLFQRHGSIRHMLKNRPIVLRWFIYYFIIQAIILYGIFGEKQFIYFQF